MDKLGKRSMMAVGTFALLGLMACQPTAGNVPVGGGGGAGTVTTTTPANQTTTVPVNQTTTTVPVNQTTTTVAPTTTTVAPTTTTIAPTTTTAPPVTTTVPTGPAGWTLVGGDEFNGTSLDGGKWKAYNNTYGDGNHELACLTPNNVSEGGGSLKIQARKETITCPSGSVRNYSSGFIGSREVNKYYPQMARFEVRAKVPHAQGMWPAFWLRHRNGASVAEVDVMEYFHALRPGQTTGTLHLDGRKNLSQKNVSFESSASTPGWHTWAVEISNDPNGVKFDFFLDDVKYHSYVDTQHNWSSAADPTSTWDMALNLAVGGSWTGEPDGTLGYLPDLSKCSIGGTAPAGCTTTGIKRIDWNDPAATTYQVDWVRVYTR